MTAPHHAGGGTGRWEVRPRTSTPSSGAPPLAEVLHHELARIERRLEAVVDEGRRNFFEGSDSYDRATVAVLRLASLFEQEQFGAALEVVTTTERRGIITTRNIAAHSGYGAMDVEIFWRTVTERLPETIARIRAANR